jgi:predicted lysophospholipase L1 biosynthesis ABC-type transport system permease subunit
MEQVNAKKNFNAVSVMAGILSWAIVGFSIICIVLFIVNLFQSYFQKVKRNLGTFKAFGISNRQLVGIYLLIIFSIIMISIVISLALAFAAELLLPMFGIMMDGAFNYLALNSSMTWIAVSIILVSSILTVYLVMRRLLSATPGNLIYDR